MSVPLVETSERSSFLEEFAIDCAAITVDAPKIASTAKTSFEVTAGTEIKQKAGTSLAVESGGTAEIKAAGQATVQSGGPRAYGARDPSDTVHCCGSIRRCADSQEFNSVEPFQN